MINISWVLDISEFYSFIVSFILFVVAFLIQRNYDQILGFVAFGIAFVILALMLYTKQKKIGRIDKQDKFGRYYLDAAINGTFGFLLIVAAGYVFLSETVVAVGIENTLLAIQIAAIGTAFIIVGFLEFFSLLNRKNSLFEEQKKKFIIDKLKGSL